MPNHVHLVVFVPEKISVSDFIRDFKKYASVEIKRQLISDNKNKIIEKLILAGGIRKYKLWMDRFDSVVIVSDKVMETKVNYIHYNPVKAGLVSEMTDWKYSSAEIIILEIIR